MTPAAKQRWVERGVDTLVFWVLVVGYVALLLSTVEDLGYARDEGFYFTAARQYESWFHMLLEHPARALEQHSVDRFWRANHEHPGLIKSLFALSNMAHREYDLFRDGGTSFRFPGMVLSALAVGVTYLWGRATVGRLPGLVAAVSLAMMPRVFYHSHLDCFDMPVVAMWLITTYAYWLSLERGGIFWALVTGVLYGLLLDTKHNAWLLPPALIAHFVLSRGPRGLWRDLRVSRTSAPLALFFMLLIGPLVFYAGWPWLWYDPIGRFAKYVAFHTGHEYYNMEFLGVTYFEPPMPRGYAWLMTIATVPTVTIVLFALGLVRFARQDLLGRRFVRLDLPLAGTERSRSRRSTRLLWLLCVLTSYAPWLSTNTPIFGGTKHWMTAYPFLCLFAASGFDWACQRIVALMRDRRLLAETARVVTAFAACIGPIVMAITSHPWGLSAYVPIVGGAPGAATLGLNRSFWGYTTGAVQDVLNDRAKKRAHVYLHDTAQDSWRQMEKDGRVRKDLRGTLTFQASDIGLYHHEQHMLRVDYQYWIDYGTVSPIHVGMYDGVPVVWVYQRPEAAKPKPKRRGKR
jgi:4-amino-4-deoxy-L-arabinose transferase-like glycosyltransferase